MMPYPAFVNIYSISFHGYFRRTQDQQGVAFSGQMSVITFDLNSIENHHHSPPAAALEPAVFFDYTTQPSLNLLFLS